jgi:putative PIN family toxin of toxin-antitoxin system
VKVVADTNIYISALLFKGQPLQLLEQATSRLVDLFVSHAILDESVSVIKRPKFRRTEGQVQEAVEIVRGLAQIAEPSRRVEAVKDDPADNRIIECAVAARADAIVSGDKHFLRLKSFEGIAIMSVRDFLNRQPAP